MDASIHHDPFRPDDADPDDGFPEGRYRSLGFSAASIAHVHEAYSAMEPEQREEIAGYWSACTDEELRADFAEQYPELTEPKVVDTFDPEQVAKIDESLTPGGDPVPDLNPSFPSARFAEAGATPDEIAKLEADFSTTDVEARQAYVEFVNKLATGDITAQLAELRAENYFTASAAAAEYANGEPQPPEETSAAAADNVVPPEAPEVAADPAPAEPQIVSIAGTVALTEIPETPAEPSA